MNKSTFKTTVKDVAKKSLPYATGALSAIAIMVFSYVGARHGTIIAVHDIAKEVRNAQIAQRKD